jgi:hypothetical protein
MSSCPNCGTEVRQGARFCARCGSLQPTAGNISPPAGGSPVAPTQKAQEPIYPPVQPPPAAGGYPPPPVGSANAQYGSGFNQQTPGYPPSPPIEPQPIRTSSPRKRTWMAIAAGVLTALVLCSVAAYLVVKWVDNAWDRGTEKVREKVEEVIGDLPTEMGTAIPKIQTEMPKFATDIATSEPMTTLEAVITESGFSIPFFSNETDTPSPGILIMEWSGDGETYQVEIEDGDVIRGEATTQYDWQADEGSYSNDVLTVRWITNDTSGCNSEMTQTYQVEDDRVQLVMSVDNCDNVTQFQDKYYSRR